MEEQCDAASQVRVWEEEREIPAYGVGEPGKNPMFLEKRVYHGSKTVWISEIDRMYGTKMVAGFTLFRGKAYLEIQVQLYNRTSEPQTFLWWANPAIAANEQTQSIFPPDVHAVLDHGRRDVSQFPIATGTYYKVDYSAAA